MIPVLRPKLRAAPRAPTYERDPLDVLPAVGGKRRGAIRTNDPEVFDAIVVADAVYVVENQADPFAAPHLALSAEFTGRLLEAFVIEPLFEVAAAECRTLDQDLFNRRRLPVPEDRLTACRVRIEVIGRDIPELDPLLERPWVAPGRAITEATKRFGP